MEGPAMMFRAGLADILEECIGKAPVKLVLGDSVKPRPAKVRRVISEQKVSRNASSGADFAAEYGQLLSKHTEDVGHITRRQHFTEAVLAALLLHCGPHGLQARFLLEALEALAKAGVLSWTSFFPVLVKAVKSLEEKKRLPLLDTLLADGQLRGGEAEGAGEVAGTVRGALTHGGSVSSLEVASVQSNQPKQESGRESQDGAAQQHLVKDGHGEPEHSWLRPLFCQVTLLAAGSQQEIGPLSCLEVLTCLLSWLNEHLDSIVDDRHVELQVGTQGGPSSGFARWQALDNIPWEDSWITDSVNAVQALTDPDRSLLPFYSLLHDRTQLQIDSMPTNDALFQLAMEAHMRRDRVSQLLTVVDGYLQCPSFASLRPALFTYPLALGEPLRGQDIGEAVPRGSLEWQRAQRCLAHGLRCGPPSDWWRRNLLHGPWYRQQQGNPPGGANRNVQGALALSVPAFSAEMTCQALVGRTLELMRPISQGGAAGASVPSAGSPTATSPRAALESYRWHEWLAFADLFYYILRLGFVDFLEFVDQLAARFAEDGPPRSNHVIWLIMQIFRLDTVAIALQQHPDKGDIARKILGFNSALTEGRGSRGAVGVLLEFIGSTLTPRLWNLTKGEDPMVGQDHVRQGKQLDEWWRTKAKGEGLDFAALDERTAGMMWVLSHTMSQPVSDALMGFLRNQGMTELVVPGPGGRQPAERIHVIREGRPLPVSFLQGLSLQVLQRVATSIEELIAPSNVASGQQREAVIPSISMMETYVRVLLVAPQTMHQMQTLHQPQTLHEVSKRSHLQAQMQAYKPGESKNALPLLVLELLNFRLLPFFRYHGRVRGLLMDSAKLLIAARIAPGEHRVYRLAENLAMNLVLSLREIALIKRELKGASSELSETLNRLIVMNLAMTIKTRGVAEFEQLVMLQPLLDQVLLQSTHQWAEKTMRYFPPLLRSALAQRPDRASHPIAQWKQVEATVLQECQLFLQLGQDTSACVAYLEEVPRQRRKYACAAAWCLMDGHTDSVNLSNLRVLIGEFSPEEVTDNVYVLVDVLLYVIQCRLQQGHASPDLLLRASNGLAVFMWVHELLPFDIVLMALADRNDVNYALRLVVGLLIDRSELKQRVQHYCQQRGRQEAWQEAGPFPRPDPQQALGGHLAGRDRYPLLFDSLSLRAVPAIQLVVHRLIESDSLATADRLLAAYSSPPCPLLGFHPSRFSYVRNTLAYFFPALSRPLIIRLLSTLDLSKVPFSEAFLQQMNPEAKALPGATYFSHLLVSLATQVVAPLNGPSYHSASVSPDGSGLASDHGQPHASSPPGGEKMLYEHMETGTFVHLLLETAAIELLCLGQPQGPSTSASILVGMLVDAAVTPAICGARSDSSSGQVTGGTTTFGGNKTASFDTPTADAVGDGAGLNGTGGQIVGQPLMVQACGLLLAQLPPPFHIALYCLVAKELAQMPLLLDLARGASPLLAVSLADSSWALENGTTTRLGRLVALVHALLAGLPFEWLEGTHALLLEQRPLRSVAQLRVAFRLIGPILPRTPPSRQLYAKTLALLWSAMADVFGEELPEPAPCSVLDVPDLVDFMHHAVMLEGGTGGRPGRRPRAETLHLCTKAISRLRPDMQKALRHLSVDPAISLYAASHPKLGRHSPVAGQSISSVSR